MKEILSLHYNGSSSCLFINGVKIYQFRAKDSELNSHPVCLGNISKEFSNDEMKQTGLNGRQWTKLPQSIGQYISHSY